MKICLCLCNELCAYLNGSFYIFSFCSILFEVTVVFFKMGSQTSQCDRPISSKLDIYFHAGFPAVVGQHCITDFVIIFPPWYSDTIVRWDGPCQKMDEYGDKKILFPLQSQTCLASGMNFSAWTHCLQRLSNKTIRWGWVRIFKSEFTISWIRSFWSIICAWPNGARDVL